MTEGSTAVLLSWKLTHALKTRRNSWENYLILWFPNLFDHGFTFFFFFLHTRSEVRTLGFDVLVQYFTSNNFIVNVGWLVT